MSNHPDSTERKANLWAPWRIAYIKEIDDREGCFLCHYRDDPDNDAEHLVLWRGRHVMAVLNRFPYTGGHLMVTPYRHVASLDDLSPAETLELMAMVRDTQKALSDALSAEGFNVGINFGHCAGAGLPGHLHVHVVPRWSGDTNFMAVLGEVRVIPEALTSVYTGLLRSSERLDLPNLPAQEGA